MSPAECLAVLEAFAVGEHSAAAGLDFGMSADLQRTRVLELGTSFAVAEIECL